MYQSKIVSECTFIEYCAPKTKTLGSHLSGALVAGDKRYARALLDIVETIDMMSINHSCTSLYLCSTYFSALPPRDTT